MKCKKFEVQFSSNTHIKPSFVYISTIPNIKGIFAVGILYIENKSQNFNSTDIASIKFGFEQNYLKTEIDAINWANNWLCNKSGGKVNLIEVI